MKNAVAVFVFCALGVSASAAEEEVTPAHVFQAVSQVAADLELIRDVMGKPVLEAPPWIVDDAEPRHVLYQVQALHLATTLLSELAHLTLSLDAKDVDLPPVERPRHIFPSHVFRMAGMLQDELATLETKLAGEG